ncbi:uncharacterized protein LOC111997062 [Quercus suber]|uniref:Embryo defective 1273 n=1 Tax=Quercus suber TaxID=58331 RepID=A0AAW0LLC2_QUESU|nr:uncharacterized protein LOC111997062 [Quercus suber]POE70165.1 hypothetical protein CFP56_43166 [Quercus suber]
MKTMVAMALPASTVLPPTPTSKFRIKHFHGQLQRHSRSCVHHQTFPTCSMKLSMKEFSDSNKFKTQINIVRKKLWEVIPDSVKEIPWKKAEDILLERLIFLGQKGLKWTLITLFIFSSLSDVIFSLSRNQELIIPLGLFVGCLMTDFIKETSQELFHHSEDKGLKLQLLGIACFFVLIKFLSTNFALQARVFLLHLANGGLMQLLWLWREERDKSNGEVYSKDQDDSLAKDGGD